MERINYNTQYYIAQEKAYEVLLNYSDGSLPINPFDIIKKIPNIKLMTYTELAQELKLKCPELSIEEIIENFESERGFLKKKGNKKYILAYNEKDKTAVYTWTLFHELGHYFLEHLSEEDETLGFCSEKIKDNLEKEANCFARHCSCPVPILKEVADTTSCSDTELLHFLTFGMGDGAIKYSSRHFEMYSHYYDNKRYKQLIKKFDKKIRDICNSVFWMHGIDWKV